MKTKPLIFLLSLTCLFFVGCVTTPNFMSKTGPRITNQTPATVLITSPRNFGSGFEPSANQGIYDMAQEHCQKSGRDAVLQKSWVRPFDADYFKFECKK